MTTPPPGEQAAARPRNSSERAANPAHPEDPAAADPGAPSAGWVLPAEPAEHGAGRHAVPVPRRHRTGMAAVLATATALALALVLVLVRQGGEAPEPVAVAAAAPTTTAAPTAPPPPNLKPIVRAPAQLRHVPPVEVLIPSLAVRSSLVDLGLNDDGTLEVPTDYAKAGWFAPGPYPGDPSGPPAVIAGHVDSSRGPAIFYRLTKLRPGDKIQVRRSDGSVAAFVVYGTRQYAKQAFPADIVYAPSPRSEIRLITCTGTFDQGRRSYLDNFVVYAALDPLASEGAP